MIGLIVALTHSIVRTNLKIKFFTLGVQIPINFIVITTQRFGKKQIRNIASMYSEVFTDFSNLLTLNLSLTAAACFCE